MEIRELVIRAVVTPQGAAPSSEKDLTAPTLNDRDEIVAECVERVLRALERAGER